MKLRMHSATTLLLLVILCCCEFSTTPAVAQGTASLGSIKQSFLFAEDDGTDLTLTDSLGNLVQGSSISFGQTTLDNFSLGAITAEGGATAIDPAAIDLTATVLFGEVFLDFAGPFSVGAGQTSGIDFSYTISSVLGVNTTNLSLDSYAVTGSGSISVDQTMEDDIAFFSFGASDFSPSTDQILSAADSVEVFTGLLLSATGPSGGIERCDFNDDSQCDIVDLDLLYANFGDTAFDVDGNGSADASDITAWLDVASVPTNPYLGGSQTFLVGDTNLDGNVNSTDLGLLLNNFGDAGSAAFGSGNLNGDANVNSTDLGLLLNNFGAMSASTTAVPEPNSPITVLLIALVGFTKSRYRFDRCQGDERALEE